MKKQSLHLMSRAAGKYGLLATAVVLSSCSGGGGQR